MLDTTTDTAAERPPTDAQEAIRTEVKRVAAAEGKAMTVVAKEAGVPYGTFSAWIGGTYAGRSDRIAEEAQKWLASRQAQTRTRALMPPAPAFMLTQSASDYFGVFEHAQHMPDMVIITGGAGVGKTSACEAYRERSSNVFLMTAEPCVSTVRMLLDGLAETLGLAEKYSSERVSKAVVRRLRGTGGLLIVDEAQHLSTQSLDQLRTIQDLARIGVALVGNETVYARLGGAVHDAKYAQLFSRVGMRLPRPRPVKRDIEVLLDAWGVAGPAERRLLAAIAGKPGALRGMTKCLRIAHMLAAAGGGGPVTEEHLLTAWGQLGNAPLEGRS